ITNQSSIETIAMIAGKQPVRSFTRKDGSPGQVARLLLYDGTAYLPLVIWNEKANVVDVFTPQSTVKVTNCYARDRDGQVELHLSNNGDIVVVPDSTLKSTMTFNKIAGISTDRSLVNLRGKIVSLGEPTTFERNDNSTGRVRSLLLRDETGDVRIVAWDRKVDELNTLMVNEAVEVILGKVRKREDRHEVHLTGFSSIIALTETPPELESITSFPADSSVKESVRYERIPIDTVHDGSKIQIRGKIVSVYRWKPFFHACPVCSKKASPLANEGGFECGEHGIVDAKPRMKFTTVIDDNYGTLRVILFGKSAAIASGLTVEPLMELFDSQQEDEMHRIIQKSMLGKEFLFSGEVRERIVDQEGETLVFKEMIARRVNTPDPVKEFDLLLATIED
ncbi:MAG: OB-fold nucleic acid binding domain-containing protein, partial [Candidatus Hodarchaeales archaeon]